MLHPYKYQTRTALREHKPPSRPSSPLIKPHLNSADQEFYLDLQTLINSTLKEKVKIHELFSEKSTEIIIMVIGAVLYLDLQIWAPPWPILYPSTKFHGNHLSSLSIIPQTNKETEEN